MANITVVQTAIELQQACLTGAVDIEIRAHLDLRGLIRPPNPGVAGAGKYDFGTRALLYSSSPLRSIRVRPGIRTCLVQLLAVICPHACSCVCSLGHHMHWYHLWPPSMGVACDRKRTNAHKCVIDMCMQCACCGTASVLLKLCAWTTRHGCERMNSHM